MRFWDSSALVPLLVEEAGTADMRRTFAEDPGVVVWALTPLEILSALRRRRRAGEISEKDFEAAEVSFRDLERSWSPIADLEHVERRARRMLAVHALRVADAAQLAAALVACRERPDLLPFLTLDGNLGEAARREGFAVLP
jgi:hypothetical protein